MHILPILILATTLLSPQVRVPGPGGTSASATPATPGLVNFSGAPSSQTNAIGARVASSVTCVANGYCLQLVEPTLSGDAILIYYTYKSTSTTAHAPTVTDDKGGGSSSYTCVTEGNDAHGTARTFVGLCYVLNAAANIRNITITYPVATNTQVAAAAGVFYNINAVDVSANNGTQSTSTSWSSGAMTTTVDGDLVCELAVGTTTRTDVSGFTAASGFSLHMADRRDALAVQCGNQITHGAITPVITGQSNAYAALGVSFKAGASGTAPSGMYVAHLYHLNTASFTVGQTYPVEFPISGNLIVMSYAMGGTQFISGVSDGTNTYTSCGPASQVVTPTQTWYAANVTPGVYTATTTFGATGDAGPYAIWDVVGAATSQTCIRYMGQEVTTPVAATLDILTNGAMGSNISLISAAYAPGATSGMSFAASSWVDNTSISLSTPTGGLNDSTTSGSEPHDGPWPIDQNQFIGHRTFSDNTPGSWVVGMTDNATANGKTGEVDSFQAPGASLRPSVVGVASNEIAPTATTIPVTMAPVATHTLVVAVGNNSSRTITKVCTDGTTCGAGNTFTQATSAACSNGTGRGDIWYLLSAPSGVTTITASFSATGVNREIYVWELSGISTFDIANHSNASVSVNPDVSASVTTTGTNGFVAAYYNVGGAVTQVPNPGNEFTSPGTVFSNTTDAVASLISLSAAAHSASVQDTTSSNFCSSVAAFK